jgi:hypothetical protein
MNYEDFEKVLSSARLNRYLTACNGDKEKTLKLYRLNIRLSQAFYAILSLFEVALRNAINGHYLTYFKDNEWLRNQCLGSGFLNNPQFGTGRFKSKKKIDAAIKELGIKYTHESLVASLSFGFWVNLFAPLQFRFAGQNLHKIFPKRPKGTLPKQIFNDLTKILGFRNRIAHHEPVCFNGTKNIDLSEAEKIHSLIIRFIEWMGLDNTRFLKDLDNTLQILDEINSLK